MRGLTFDLIAIRVLALVEGRKVLIFEHEHSAAEQGRSDQHGHGAAIKADARRLDRRDLIGPGQQTEAGERRHQHAQRNDGKEQDLGNKKTIVV